MRKIHCLESAGVKVQDVLDEFNERSEELGVPDDAELISITTEVLPEGARVPILIGGKTQTTRVAVTIFYFAD